MELALSLASNVNGQTSPNPPVGAVIVKDGRIVGMGAHLRAGDKHAEIIAIEQAKSACLNADLYVSLEPCAHVGKTPPCVDAILRHRFRRVYIAAIDPNPLVGGKGIERLKQADIEVTTHVCNEQAKKLYASFFHYIQTTTPYVTMKTAMTIDGKIATATGDSKWITGEQARFDVHLERQRHDAILVGIQTILSDNPLLTTRLPQGSINPIRIVLDTTLRMPVHAHVVTDGAAKTLIFCSSKALESKQRELEKKSFVEVIRLSTPTIDIPTVLDVLGQKGIVTLLVEGGSSINASFIEARKVNRIVTYIAPKLLGGKNAFTPISGLGIQSIRDAMEFQFEQVEMIGQDLKLVGRLV